MTQEIRHFLDIHQLDSVTLRSLLNVARDLKQENKHSEQLCGCTLAMLFEQPSTRTRLSFEVAMRQLGGETIALTANDMQLGRGETIADTARVLSRYVDVVMLRTDEEEKLKDLVQNATIPVINGLTDQSHPCQVMADVMTYEEHRGSIAGRVIAWCGVGNNVTHSWIHAAVRFGFTFCIACPEKLTPEVSIVDWAKKNGAEIIVTSDPQQAVKRADCVITDTWYSMSQRHTDDRHILLTPYQVTKELMSLAKSDALFMHCLPAHRGQEVSAEVIDGPWSVIWDEVDNRRHVQKAILLWCLNQ